MIIVIMKNFHVLINKKHEACKDKKIISNIYTIVTKFFCSSFFNKALKLKKKKNFISLD